MSKFIHTADIHLYENHKYSIDGSRLKAIERNLMLMVKYAIKKKIDFIILAGDIFHVYNPSENLLKIFTNVVKYAVTNGVNVRVLSGNHDTNGVDYAFASLNDIENLYPDVGIGGMATLRIISLKKGEEVIDTEKFGNTNFVYVPWQENLPTVLMNAKKKRNKDLFNVLVTHCAVDSASTNSGYSIKNTKISKSMLSGWDYVALGDFHKYQNLGENIYYSGSISKTVWDERHDDRAFNFVTIDSDNVGVKIKKIKLPDSEFIELKIKNKDIDEWLHGGKYMTVAGKSMDGAFIKVFITDYDGAGNKIMDLKKKFIDSGAKDVFFRLVKKVESDAVNIDGDEIHLNLDIKTICELFLDKQSIDDVNYMAYLEKKIMEVM